MYVDETLLYDLIGAALKHQRQQAALTQAQLAEAIGVLRTSITNMEAGRQRPPLHVLYALCLTLGVEVTEILPPTAAVLHSGTQQVATLGMVTDVPPKTAALLKALLEEEVQGEER